MTRATIANSSWTYRRRTAIAVALTAGASIAAVATVALGQGSAAPPFLMATMDPQRIVETADKAVRHVAIEIDATPDQQERMRAIVKALVTDVVPLRDKAASARERGRLVLTQPTVDRALLEQLRVEQLSLADALSKRVTQAVGDMASVLTYDQRRQIDSRIAAMRERRGWWMPWQRG